MLNQLGNCQTRFEALGGYEMEVRAQAALSGLGFRVEEFKEPFQSFSGGWQMRAELARTLISHPDVLLLDEPSNYLDIPAVVWLQRYLRDFTGTMLLISHDRYLLSSLSSTILEVAGGDVVRYAGGFDYYQKERENRIHQQESAQRNIDRKREHLEKFVERFRAKNTKASQVQSRIKMLEKMEDAAGSVQSLKSSGLRIAEPPHCGSEVMRLEGVGLSYDDEHWVFRDVDLSINRGQKIAIVGYNGMGKTSLLRVLAGAREPNAGKRVPGHKVVVGYQSQEFAETMPPDRSVINIVRDRGPEVPEKEVRGILGGFGFSGDAVSKPCEVLSGGEKIRLAFARLFVDPPNLLLLDEPTTHLDIDGREALEEALREYSGTVCLVSHDIEFVKAVADGIIVIGVDGVTQYHGGYDYFVEKSGQDFLASLQSRGDASEPMDRSPGVQSPKGQDKKAARRERAQERQSARKNLKAMKRRVEQAESQMFELGQEQTALTDAMSAGAEGFDFESAGARLAEIQKEIEVLAARWEEDSLQIEALES